MSASAVELSRVPHVNFQGRKLFFLHESIGTIRGLLTHDLLDQDSVIISTFSWYSDERKMLSFKSYFEALRQEFPDKYDLLINNTIFAGNSLSEYQFIRNILPLRHAVHFNNAAMVSEKLFQVGNSTRRYDALVNAKPCLFKRHYLLQNTENWAFVTYKYNETKTYSEDFFDIKKLPTKALFEDIEAWQVSGLLTESFCGIILSEIEGACYASLEYLLSGLPVVSTKSLGGRDDFYDSYNSRIVDPIPDDIERAVQTIVQQTREGAIDHALIRANAVKRMEGFRAALAQTISDCIGLPQTEIYQALTKAIHMESKLDRYRLAWKDRLADGLQPPGKAVLYLSNTAEEPAS